MSSWKAKKIIRSQLRRVLTGSSRKIHLHTQRGEMMAELIYKRFQVLPIGWQVKHCRWVLEHALRDRADSTRYQYFLTLRLWIERVAERWDDWEPLLRGSWLRPTGSEQKNINFK